MNAHGALPDVRRTFLPSHSMVLRVGHRFTGCDSDLISLVEVTDTLLRTADAVCSSSLLNFA